MGFIIILGLSVWACVLTRSQLTPIISNIFNLTLWESPWVRSGAALMREGSNAPARAPACISDYRSPV